MLETFGANEIVSKSGKKWADIQNARQHLLHLEIEDWRFWLYLCRCILNRLPESMNFVGLDNTIYKPIESNFFLSIKKVNWKMSLEIRFLPNML